MKKIFKANNLRITIVALLIFFTLIIFYKKPLTLSIEDYKITQNQINTVELDLQSYLIYNNPSISIWEDYKNLINGRYSHSVYKLHKFNLTISFLFLLIPVLLIFFIFLNLGMSFRMTFFIVLIFSIFTIFPIIIF